MIAAYRELVSALLAGRRVLRRDHGVALVARPGDRGRASRGAAGGARRTPGCFSSTGRRRSTAADGARITASTCRSSSTTSPIVPRQGRHRRRRAGAVAGRMSDALLAFARTGRPATPRPAGVAGLRSDAARDDGVRPRDRAWSTIRAATNAACSPRCPMFSPARNVGSRRRAWRSSPCCAGGVPVRADAPPAPPIAPSVLETMKRATTFMVEKVSTSGGYVWSYLPDLSRRWGEMEARADDDLDPAAGHGDDGPPVPRRVSRHRRRLLLPAPPRRWPAR